MVRTLELIESRVSARTRWHFVVLRDGDTSAVGECSDAGDTDAVIRRLTALTPSLEGRDLLADRTSVVDELTRAVESLPQQEKFAAATVLGGLEQSLVDFAAQADGEPVWKWLGGVSPDRVPLYANINRMPGGRSPADVAEMAARAVAAGFTSVKCAPFDVREPGQDLADTGVARLRAIRTAIGEDVGLKVDFHERLTAEDVHRVLPAMEELGVAWLEDAFAVQHVEDLRRLRAATTLPLAGGELMFHLDEARTAVAEHLVDVLMPDVKHAGGIERTLSIARAATGTAISPHNPSGPVATAASAHLLAACPNATVLEHQFGEVPWRPELVDGAENITDGHLHVSDRPGLGVRLRTDHPSCRVLWTANI
ncbi:mandelate racemase/muconate lactonizing enzyme family protein [Amycolatopsis sp. NPDC051371]|uniref:mandelate racemase/muconate lactonizing enzyme family protein n=1 Tax=Amycolatopsis sp. NPDC051371 TaxID=3155800 RepID=UPI003429EB7F